MQINKLVTEQSDDTKQMEAQVLEMVDKLYNVYVVQVRNFCTFHILDFCVLIRQLTV